MGTLKEKSERNWNLGLRLKDDGDFDAAANRLYYALFQAVKCFATRRGVRVSTFGDAHSQMAGIVKEQYPALKRRFYDMMELRKRADYEPESVLAADLDVSCICDAQTVRNYFVKEGDA